MGGLQIFKNPQFGQVRIVAVKDKPYAVGVDVARALEYANPSKAVIDHCKGDFLTWKVIDNLGREQNTRIIPEGDIYRLIFKAADQSISQAIKEKAEKFEKWLFDEVLPSINKNGFYGLSANPDNILDSKLERIDKLKKCVNPEKILALKILAFKEAQVETGKDYSAWIEIMESPLVLKSNLLDATGIVLAYMKANMNVGVSRDGCLLVPTSKFKIILTDLGVDYHSCVKNLHSIGAILALKNSKGIRYSIPRRFKRKHVCCVIFRKSTIS